MEIHYIAVEREISFRLGISSQVQVLWVKTERDGMGLLEYQAMSCFRDVAHDNVLCAFSNRSAPDRGRGGVVREGRRHGPPIS
jgi:hypothetical protein